MNNKFEILNTGNLNKDYFEIFDESIYELSPGRKPLRLRSNIFLTSLIVGSSFLVPTAAISSYQRIDSTSTYLIEKGVKVSDDVICYIEDLNSIGSLCFSKIDLLNNILSFKTLNNNWDGYGSIPLEVLSACNSILLLDFIGIEIFGKVKDFYPNPNGTISFEWNNDQNESLVLEVGNKTFSYYVSFNSQATLYFDNKLVNESNSKILSDFIKAI